MKKKLFFPEQPVSCQEADTFKTFTEPRYAEEHHRFPLNFSYTAVYI